MTAGGLKPGPRAQPLWDSSGVSTDGQRSRQPIAWRNLGLVCGITGLVLVVVSGRYGYHRDELYFLAAGRHLAWGYPDQPPLTPFLARLMDDVGGGSLVVFRLPATLAAMAVTLLTGLLARELGGGLFAQTLAAFTVAVSTYVLLSGHLLVTSTVDLLVWVSVIWLVVRILNGADPRLWLVGGLISGLGFWNKQLPVVLLFGLFVGALLTPPARRFLRSPWLWAGMAVAAAMWVPVLAWQAHHGWPQLTLAGQIRDEYGTPGERVNFVFLQFALFGFGGAYLWVVGLRHLWKDPAWRTMRLLAWTWLTVLVFFVITAGQGYYPSGVYPSLIAAGAVVVERYRRRWPVAILVGISALVVLPAALPLLPPVTFGKTFWAGIAEPQIETIGWPWFVDQVAAAYATIPADQRGTAGIYATNYGEAGAIDRFGPELGLPPAWSGHNGFGLWGPPPGETAPVVVVWQDGTPSPFFDGCRLSGDVDTGVENEEGENSAVWVCTGPSGGWASAWQRLVHLSS